MIIKLIKFSFNQYFRQYSNTNIRKFDYILINEVPYMDDSLKVTGFYQELLKTCKNNYHDYIQNNEPSNYSKINFKKKKVLYDYFMTPYEGLYINENIVGIIKYRVHFFL